MLQYAAAVRGRPLQRSWRTGPSQGSASRGVVLGVRSALPEAAYTFCRCLLRSERRIADVARRFSCRAGAQPASKARLHEL